MNDYISRDAAICVADYAVDEHPYDKDPAKPETFFEYNQGWHDACDYIRERLETAEKTNVAPRQRGHWISAEEAEGMDRYDLAYCCSVCGHCDWDCTESEDFKFCPNCGAQMDGGVDNGNAT